AVLRCGPVECSNLLHSSPITRELLEDAVAVRFGIAGVRGQAQADAGTGVDVDSQLAQFCRDPRWLAHAETDHAGSLAGGPRCAKRDPERVGAGDHAFP